MGEYEKAFMDLAFPIIDLISRNIDGARLFNACRDLFNYSQDIRPNKLLLVSSKNLLPIGCAFGTLATKIDYGNPDINSISAENALYCVIKHYKDIPDTFGALPLYVAVNLIMSDHRLMHDTIMYVVKLNAYQVLSFHEQINFRSGENAVRSHVLRYLIPQIFDTTSMDFIYDDMPLAPDRNAVIEWIHSSYYQDADPNKGKEYFEQMFDYCKLGVSQP